MMEAAGGVKAMVQAEYCSSPAWPVPQDEASTVHAAMSGQSGHCRRHELYAGSHPPLALRERRVILVCGGLAIRPPQNPVDVTAGDAHVLQQPIVQAVEQCPVSADSGDVGKPRAEAGRGGNAPIEPR